MSKNQKTLSNIKVFSTIKYSTSNNNTTLKTILFEYHIFIEVVSIDLTLRWNYSHPKMIHRTQKKVQSFSIAQHFILTFWLLRGYFWFNKRWNWVTSFDLFIEFVELCIRLSKS